MCELAPGDERAEFTTNKSALIVLAEFSVLGVDGSDLLQDVVAVKS
jgi:hypothetical protein